MPVMSSFVSVVLIAERIDSMSVPVFEIDASDLFSLELLMPVISSSVELEYVSIIFTSNTEIDACSKVEGFDSVAEASDIGVFPM